MLRDAAILQVALEGVALPARKKELLDYAREQDAEPRVIALLDEIEDREYRHLDEVGEALAPVQPKHAPTPRGPAVESDEPPGGESYVDPHAEPGTIREQPRILVYEEQLVRVPGPPRETAPTSGERDEKPGS